MFNGVILEVLLCGILMIDYNCSLVMVITSIVIGWSSFRSHECDLLVATLGHQNHPKHRCFVRVLPSVTVIWLLGRLGKYGVAFRLCVD